MRLNRNTIRFIIGLSAGLLIALLVAFNTLLFWVATGPRQLSALTPAIAASFGAADGSYRVSIGETWLLWDGWKHPIDIRLKQVDVLTADGQVFSSFPEVAVGLHIPSLFLGRILPTSLTIDKPVVSLFQHENRSVSFGFKAQTGESSQPREVPLALLFGAISQQDAPGALKKLRSVRITQADVSIGRQADGIVLEATGVEMVLKRSRRHGLEFLMSGKVSYDEYQSTFAADFKLPPASTQILGEVDFKGVDIATLVDLFTVEDQPVPVSVPISGTAQIALSGEGEVEQLAIKAEGGQGAINTPELTAPLAMNWVRLDAVFSDKLRTIQIRDLSADIQAMLLKAQGEIKLSEPNDAAIKLSASLANVPMEMVNTLWPVRLAPISREWVTGNIKGGMIPEARITTNIEFGDLAKPVLPKESIDASISLQGAAITYLPEHPPANNVKAIVKVDGVALDAAVESADYMEATKLSKGRVLIEDLNADNPYIKLSMSAESNAKETVQFLGLPKLNHSKRLNLKPEQVSGKVSAQAEVGFFFFSPKDEAGKPLDPDIDYKVKATGTDLSAPGFMHKFDISQATGEVVVDKQQLTFQGQGSINGAQASEVSVTYLFEPQEGIDTLIKASATASKESLARFGLGKLDMLQGSLGVKADIKLGAEKELANLLLDLTPSMINARQIGWSKPAGEQASLSLTAEKKAGMLKIPSFELKGKAIEASGALSFNDTMNAVKQAKLERVKIGNTSLNLLAYEAAADGFSLSVAGESADLSGVLESTSSSSNEFSFEKFPAAKLDVNISKLIMAGGMEMRGVKGHLTCSALRCESADIVGTVAQKPFSLRIYRQPKTVRQLSIRAEDAGAFLKSLALYDRMEGGVLSISGQYVDSGADSLLRARMDISEHTIKKAPVLAKILTLASLTGFFDMLEGNGIRFTKMVIPFALQNDVITVSKARAYGNAIGITAEGTITFPAVVFDVKGTVVPSYTANTILGKLPIIGDVLTGGDGKGVFAGNYSVKGTYEDPKVAVNPLSILTPGILRGIFDVGDKN